MKSLKERTTKPRKNSEEHILPLINVVFLLLIFFMIAGRLSASDPFEIDPSKSISSRPLDEKTGIIHMGDGARLAFQNREVTLDELKIQIGEYLQKHPDEVLRLKVGSRQEAGKVLSLMTSLRDVGVEKISLVTQMEPSS